ncbi:MAG TPA: CHAD domain-containing protein [Mycobacteriales bacterium]|nr:CHAD domain-containing protein [Mycobacteriales bacterium]
MAELNARHNPASMPDPSTRTAVRGTPPGARHFDVPALFTLPALDGADGRPGAPGIAATRTAAPAPLRIVHLDTPDLRLTRAGVTLQHSSGRDARARWTVTVPSLAAPVIETHVGAQAQIPTPVLDLLTPWLRGADVAPVATLRAERRAHSLLDVEGNVVGEVFDDTVSVIDGRRVMARSRELVLVPADRATEPVDAELLEAVVTRLAEAGATPNDGAQDAVLRALGPRATASDDIPATGRVRPTDPAAAVVAHALRSGASKLRIADSAVRRDLPDGVHQMRVACRRMRSDLKTFAALVDHTWAERIRNELSWLAGSLGAARDLEVQRGRLADVASADPLAPLDPGDLARLDTMLAAREDVARKHVAKVLRSKRYVAVVDLLVESAAWPRTTPAADAPASAVLPPLVLAAWERLVRSVGKLDDHDPDDDWHRARIHAKRARYAAEAVVPALGARAGATAKAAAAIQEVLGDHQDAATAAALVLDIAAAHAHDGDFCVTLGRLAERERAAVRRSRERMPAVWAATRPSKVVAWARP